LSRGGSIECNISCSWIIKCEINSRNSYWDRSVLSKRVNTSREMILQDWSNRQRYIVWWKNCTEVRWTLRNHNIHLLIHNLVCNSYYSEVYYEAITNVGRCVWWEKKSHVIFILRVCYICLYFRCHSYISFIKKIWTIVGVSPIRLAWLLVSIISCRRPRTWSETIG